MRRMKLSKLVSKAKDCMLEHLKTGSALNPELEQHVLSIINVKKKTKQHVTEPVHILAYILAYKELEAEGKIKIERGNVPFPTTDFGTVFALVGV